MSENSQKPKNIFEAASHIEKARAKKKSTPRVEETEQMTIITDIVHRGRKLHEELASQVDTLFARSKIAPSDYRRYLSKPQNFSAKEWQQLDEQKKKNADLLRELAQKVGAKTTKPPEPEEEIAPKLVEKRIPPLKEEVSPHKEDAPPEKKPPQKKPKIITRRHWIGM